MGDHGKQVSWLAALGSLHHLPGTSGFQWSSMRGTPLTVAGAARALNPSSHSIPVRGTCRMFLRCRKTAHGSTGGPARRRLVRIVALRPVVLMHQRLDIKAPSP